MGSEKQSVKKQLNEYLLQRAPERITETGWRSIRERFHETSEGYLRRLLRDSGAEMEPLVEGVRQDSYDELRRTLCNLEQVYASASRTGDRARMRECRRLVIDAKDHARFAGKRAKDEVKRAAKEEMVLWMLTWLDDPALFPVWVELRKRALGSGGA